MNSPGVREVRVAHRLRSHSRSVRVGRTDSGARHEMGSGGATVESGGFHSGDRHQSRAPHRTSHCSPKRNPSDRPLWLPFRRPRVHEIRSRKELVVNTSLAEDRYGVWPNIQARNACLYSALGPAARMFYPGGDIGCSHRRIQQ